MLVMGEAGISIHALLAESDRGLPVHNKRVQQFLSTLSLRRATPYHVRLRHGQSISIHALLAESDASKSKHRAICCTFLSTLSLRRATSRPLKMRRPPMNFYPRSPCGERHYRDTSFTKWKLFLSTLSLRRATAKVHKTVGHFCAYETNFMGIASSC